MKLTIPHQPEFSRSELVLRTLFGWLYIGVPHGIILGLLSIALLFMYIYAFFAVMFTGRYPESAYTAFQDFLNWRTRVEASLLNLVDGYPPFGLKARWDKVSLDIPYPKIVTRKRMLFATFVAIFTLIPHFLILMFRFVGMFTVFFVAFWVVLVTRKFPKELHDYQVGTLRWQLRTYLYTVPLYFNYPEFSGRG